MIQFLNNIGIALSSENTELLNILFIPGGFLEHYLFMTLFLTVFNVEANKKQKILYVISTQIVSMLSLHFIPSPYYIIFNYAYMVLFIKFIFKLNLLNSFMSLIFSTSVFGILNVLLQNPYITILGITFDKFMVTPIYRIPYIAIQYLFVFGVILLLRKFTNIKFTLNVLDSLDKKALKILFINLCIGFLTLCIQLITTAFYIDIVPIFISILNFLLLIAFFLISSYSLTRMIKLATTRIELASAEEYNKSLEILYDKVKGFKHDYENIVSTLDGFIEINDIDGLKKYFAEVKKDCKITNNLSIINPRVINNPGIYNLLNNKYFKATNKGVTFNFEFFLNLNTLQINMYQFSRILGILIDNAIEEAEKCDNKDVSVSLIRENRNNRSVVTIKNTYLNKDVNIEKIFEKGLSGKENHSGIGLWEVKNYIRKSKNLDLYTTKNDKYFIQELSIYDL